MAAAVLEAAAGVEARLGRRAGVLAGLERGEVARRAAGIVAAAEGDGGRARLVHLAGLAWRRHALRSHSAMPIPHPFEWAGHPRGEAEMHRALVKFILHRRSHGSARKPPVPPKGGDLGLAPPSPIKPRERAGAPAPAADTGTGRKRRAEGDPLEEGVELLCRRRRREGAYQPAGPAGTALRLPEQRDSAVPARGAL